MREEQPSKSLPDLSWSKSRSSDSSRVAKNAGQTGAVQQPSETEGHDHERDTPPGPGVGAPASPKGPAPAKADMHDMMMDAPNVVKSVGTLARGASELAKEIDHPAAKTAKKVIDAGRVGLGLAQGDLKPAGRLGHGIVKDLEAPAALKGPFGALKGGLQLSKGALHGLGIYAGGQRISDGLKKGDALEVAQGGAEVVEQTSKLGKTALDLSRSGIGTKALERIAASPLGRGSAELVSRLAATPFGGGAAGVASRLAASPFGRGVASFSQHLSKIPGAGALGRLGVAGVAGAAGAALDGIGDIRKGNYGLGGVKILAGGLQLVPGIGQVAGAGLYLAALGYEHFDTIKSVAGSAGTAVSSGVKRLSGFF